MSGADADPRPQSSSAPQAAGPSPTGAPELAIDAYHVLVVDDDRRIRDLLSRYLRQQGYRVSTASGAREARGRLSIFIFDLIVLDVMMPGENGIDFARALRKDSDVPILMLTARADAADRVLGLEAGVDDYLAKPFEPKELALRIASILRRAAPREEAPGSVRFGPFEFDLARGELMREGEAVRLSESERRILLMLARAPGEAISREALAGDGPGGNERTIDVQVNRLRRKIEADPADPRFLQTARGAGYRLVTDR
jgi:two-component system phosphate regulon response regulator OmpR